ncbi:MAG: cobalamin transport system permease protein [Pseudonocardiales bacterium]|jgi:iron complex transport system permease protein|nr:cobalamin transport system permease protein [Pseudonocardiales bacterium]
MTSRAAATAVPRARRGSHPARIPVTVSAALLLGAMVLAVAIGPVREPLGSVVGTVLAHLPLIGYHTSTTPLDQAIVWDLRLPRVALAALVGAMLSAGGASYQGVFRNSLADPYLLGAAAGAGLGATIAIVAGGRGSLVLPAAAFAGAVVAVTMTYVVAAAGAGRSAGYAIVVAGIAVTGMFTAVQTYLQQQNTDEIRQIYNWLLGSFSVATWADVRLVLPYLAVSVGVLLAHRRILDVLRVGPDEAGALGIHPERTRLIIVGAATLGTAAAVSVSGLIGFVGVIVPHAVRLLAGASYRIVLPVSMLGGAAFMVLADLLARTVQSPTELPIGVVTAAIGAPFFLFVLRSRRTRQGVL